MDLLNAIILGIVEGLTEFLPISSTGHLILVEALLGIDGNEPRWKVFLFVSQIGAIAAVVVYFWRDLWRRVVDPLRRRKHTPLPLREGTGGGYDSGRSNPHPTLPLRGGGVAHGAGLGKLALRGPAGGWAGYLPTKLVAAMVPTIILGLLLNDFMERHLESGPRAPLVVAGALLVGAVLMEFIDRRWRRRGPMSLDDVSLPQAVGVGVLQCLSMWPGTSRAAASIMSGMVLGMTPSVATEFSFYLAIPTMLAAGTKRLWDNREYLTWDAAAVILAGTATAFLVALLVVATFMNYVRRYRFTPFAVYRVVLGAAVVIYYFAANRG